MIDLNFEHKSVLLEETIENLNIKSDGLYVDGTLGGGGHSYEICKRLKNGRLIGIDQDENAIIKAGEKLSEFENIEIVRDNFSNIKQILCGRKADGVILDLGVSSHQFDEGERGFSYNYDARLDMRMDNRNKLSAYEIVNDYTLEELTKIFYEYGEEKWSKRIAEFIVEERKEKEILTTFELVEIIKKAIPKKARQDGPHPAKRIFQAIRIEVNSELSILEQSIIDIADCLNTGGRICVITFHSLEDRIIKNIFRKLYDPCTCPKDFPICICNKKQLLKIITKKPIISTDEEIISNNRARSAKLRVAEKV